MRSSSLLQVVVAEALRTTIRMSALFAEVRPQARSLPRALLAANAAQRLTQELGRLRGYGDLLAPVTTFAEAEQRERRHWLIGSPLPPVPGLLATAEELLDQCTELLSGTGPGEAELAGAERGQLVALEEQQLLALEQRLRRRGDWANEVDVAPALRLCVQQVHAEAAALRTVEDSRLANRLVVDRGFLDTFVQARKRARDLVRGEAAAGSRRNRARSVLKRSELAQLQRWHASVLAQLTLLEGGADWRGLREHAQELHMLLNEVASLTRLGSALANAQSAKVQSGKLKSGKRKAAAEGQAPIAGQELAGLVEDRRRQRATELLAALPRLYGLGKSNFRQLVGSELA